MVLQGNSSCVRCVWKKNNFLKLNEVSVQLKKSEKNAKERRYSCKLKNGEKFQRYDNKAKS